MRPWFIYVFSNVIYEDPDFTLVLPPQLQSTHVTNIADKSQRA